MDDASLFDEIVKSDGPGFRGVDLGASKAVVVAKEGTRFEEKGGSSPHYAFALEIGEMEELRVTYNFVDEVVHAITVHFVSYPDHYWKKAHGALGPEFDQALTSGGLRDCSKAYLATREDVLKHFTEVFGHAPSVERRDGAFSAPHHQFATHSWAREEGDIRLSVMSYVDDTDWNSVKNTLKIHLRRY